MPLVKRIRKRGGVNMVIEAHGEIEFAPTGDVTQWMRGFSNRTREFTRSAAPSNKRPRWTHNGPPLKDSFRASTKANPGQLRVDAAVGSVSHYAAFVNDGTQPHEAKLLPPWKAGGYPLLWEWHWPPGKKDAGPMIVRGQKGQHFFEEGLHRAFLSEGMPSVVVPFAFGRMATFPDRVADFLGTTPWQTEFKAQLAEWRAERDAAWSEHSKIHAPRTAVRKSRARLGRIRQSEESKRERAAAAARKYRRGKAYAANQRKLKENRAKEMRSKKPKRGYASVQAKNAAALDAFIARNPSAQVRKTDGRGIYVNKGVGKPLFIPWVKLYGLLPR